MEYGSQRSFSLVNLGCKVNRVESDAFRAALIAQGIREVDEENADFVIINTCTVTAEADKKARKACHHALSANPEASVIVTGCAASISPNVFLEMSPRVSVVDKFALVQELGASNSDALRVGEGFRTRVNIKIQDGCDHACSYCIVHVARGKATSLPASQVIAEARTYFAAGVKEIVLAGIDIGAYESEGMRVAQLCKKLIEVADRTCDHDALKPRIRISSIEPMNVGESLVELLATSEGRVCRHLHLPLQSGSSRVLAEMYRPYSAEAYLELVKRLKEAVPGISLSTDVIVGFPGETESDFSETCNVVRACGFSRLHVFPYSMRPGTPAAARTDQIPAEIKKERASHLRKIGQELRELDRTSRMGTRECALVEGMHALSESYHEIDAPAGSKTGELVMVTL